ncbi:uncharacterized protein LOC144903954 [Branchiostoma floridae x Branchiostoma belcheri]
MQPGKALLLTVSLMFYTSLLTAGQATKEEQLQTPAPFDPTAAPFDLTDMPYEPTDVPFDMTTAGPTNATWLVHHKSERTNPSPAQPGWHDDSFLLKKKRQAIHLLIGAGSALLLAITLVICIFCLLSYFELCAEPQPEVLTDFTPQRDGRRKTLARGEALPMTELRRHNASPDPDKLNVTMSGPPIQETV